MAYQSFVRLVLGVGIATVFASIAHAQSVDRFGRPSWMSSPSVQGSESDVSGVNGVDGGVRDARAKMFSAPRELGPQQDISKSNVVAQGWSKSEDLSRPPSLPISHADVIASGVVTSTRPFLSEDRSQVYSDLSFVPDTILKDSLRKVTGGGPIVIVARGGSIRFPNGVVATSYGSEGSSPFNVNTHYLLFLHYVPEAQAYTVIKAWDTSGSKPREMDENGLYSPSTVSPDSNSETTSDSLPALVESRIAEK